MKTTLIAAGILLGTLPECLSQSTFTRITTGSVVTDMAYSLGCAWGDYDNDGFDDLVVGDANAFYRNNGDGTFTRIDTNTIATTIGDTDGVVWGDYDNDGDLDLFAANWRIPSFLFRNDGGGIFTRIIGGRLGTNASDSVGCAWGDYDNDGFLDLVVANGNHHNEFLYRNDGNGGFTQIFATPIPMSGHISFGPRWLDYDLDRRLDLFLLPGGTNNRNMLFQNVGAGNFRVIQNVLTTEIGVGTDWGDFDNDGDLDLFGFRRGANGANETVLYRNDGNGNFTPIPFGDRVSGGGNFDVSGVWCGERKPHPLTGELILSDLQTT